MTTNQQKLDKLFEEFKDKSFDKSVKLLRGNYNKINPNNDILDWADNVETAWKLFDDQIKYYKEGSVIEFEDLIIAMQDFIKQYL